MSKVGLVSDKPLNLLLTLSSWPALASLWFHNDPAFKSQLFIGYLIGEKIMNWNVYIWVSHIDGSVFRVVSKKKKGQII